MKNIIITILSILAIVFITLYIFKKPITNTITNTEYVYDTIIHTINTSTIIPGEVIYDTLQIPVYIDTNKVINDYYTLHPFKREWNDTNISITLNDTITQNKFKQSTLNYKLLKPQTIINNTIVKNDKMLFIYTDVNTNQQISSGVEYYQNKLKYKVGYNFDKGIEFGISYRIK